jgi:hypothetical protein
MAHLTDDLDRLCHADASVQHGFVAHLYRLSTSPQFSRRDWSPLSSQIVSLQAIVEASRRKFTRTGEAVEILYVLAGRDVGQRRRGAWWVVDGQVEHLAG